MDGLVLEYPETRSEASRTTSTGSDLCLLLLGKTGHGKSASGNSVLGTKHFKTSPGCESVTTFAEMASRTVEGRKIKVVDTQGLADTRLDTEEAVRVAMDAFNRGVSLCPDGFHALILVFKFGTRMTTEEQMAVERLKEMLGKDIIKEYTILLFTHGDIFDPDEVNMTFAEWCRSEHGYMRNLIAECDNRCVLFNNKTKDKAEMSRQRQELLNCIDGLQSKGKRYTNWLFDKAKETWLTLNRQRKYAKVINEVNAVMGEISTDLLVAQERANNMGDAYFDGLRDRLRDLQGRITDMEEPEKTNLQSQIMQMDKRILHAKEKRGNEEVMQKELKELHQQAQDMKQQHMAQMRQYQNDFVRAQEQMFGKLLEMMQDGMNRQMQVLQAMQRRQQGGGSLLSIGPVNVDIGSCNMS